ncbi:MULTISPECIES: maltose acetyltransferase domain-containing protein [unclassified Paenibacillus]|nr:maltose acetyltransferase domain-containing protein [Paenibacillus sp. MZ03-122A]MCP3781078.1 hypothetical protein [Paenibacillus sp. MZ03-122A]
MIEERLYAKSLCHEYNQLHPRKYRRTRNTHQNFTWEDN